MELISKSEFAKLAGVSPAAITKALKPGKRGGAPRLEEYLQTGKIDRDSALAQSYLRNPTEQRLVAVSADNPIPKQQQNKAVLAAVKGVQKAQKARLLEDKAFKEQKRIELEFKNAVRRGDYVSIDAVNKTVMIFLDRWLNENERVFSSKFDEIERKIVSNSKNRPKIKQDFMNFLRERAHVAKINTCEQLKKIQQSQKKIKV